MKKEEYQPTGKTYHIKTIKQLFDVMTKENFPYLMADLFKTGELMLALDSVNKIVAEGAGEKYSKIKLPVFEWVDDGKNNLNEVTLSDNKGNTFDIGDALRNTPNI